MASSSKKGPFDNRLGDFLVSLNQADCIDAAWGQTQRFMHDLGASNMGLHADLEGTDPWLEWTTPPWVADMYREEVFPDHDPVLDYCRENLTPTFFGKEFECQNPNLPEPRRRYCEALTQADVHSGIIVPIHTRSNVDWGTFRFATNLSNDGLTRFAAEHASTVMLAGTIAFETIRALVKAEQAVEIGLTPRERECLLWLAKGLRNEQIAHRLGLKPVTVEFHLANARNKLGARTREQALAIALQKGLVEP